MLGIGPWGWGGDLTETGGVHMIPAEVRAAAAELNSTAVCTGVVVGVTAIAVATNLPFHYTYPSIKALAKPLLRYAHIVELLVRGSHLKSVNGRLCRVVKPL